MQKSMLWMLVELLKIWKRFNGRGRGREERGEMDSYVSKPSASKGKSGPLGSLFNKRIREDRLLSLIFSLANSRL